MQHQEDGIDPGSNSAVVKAHLRDLSEISRGGGEVGGGDFQWSYENKMSLSTKGIKMSRPSLGTGPKIPWPSPA